MKITKLKQFDSNSSEEGGDKGKTEWYLSCGLLFLFFLGLLAVLGIIFTVFGKIILALFMTN
ncbi:hypothetical protein UJ101_02143 [Flavobacteriaceae bacterium UJ101]|nr:hypothetical protein UJ101_02143 [Flavobacteriaceae bacterium UJ101]